LYYENKIKINPEYEFCGIYCDSGISGNKEEREGLQSMMTDVRAGQIDLILTKSISRFARSTRIILKYVRELQQLGVAIEFEEQNLNSSTANGEVMLTIMASFAEEERKNVSDNIKWATRKKFKQGKILVDTTSFMGYIKDEDGKLIVQKEEAEIIKLIFKKYLEGTSAYKIAKEFNEMKIPTDHGYEWKYHRILRIISNEKYKGDCLSQKTFVSEFTWKQQKNCGEIEQVYIKNNHEAIVSEEDWEKAQKIKESRKHKTYAYSGFLHCPYCGATLNRHKKWKDKYNWVCSTYIYECKSKCKGIKVPEDALEGMTFTENIVVEEIEENGKKSYSFTPQKDYQRASTEAKSGRVLQSFNKQRRSAIKLQKSGELL
jgi:DNA invertase Pin-like site-specific DNA recombinase